jgi:hypothetical protein
MVGRRSIYSRRVSRSSYIASAVLGEGVSPPSWRVVGLMNQFLGRWTAKAAEIDCIEVLVNARDWMD